MISTREIRKDYSQAGAFHSLLNVDSAFDRNIFLTKSGDLFLVMRADGTDPEGRDANSLDSIARHTEAALKSIGPEFRIYQYFLSMPSEPIVAKASGSAVETRAAAERAAFLAARNLYERKIYWVMVHEVAKPSRSIRAALNRFLRDPGGFLRQCLSTAASRQALDEELAGAAAQLRQKTGQFIGETSGDLSLTILDKHEAFRFLRYLVTLAPVKSGRQLHHDDFIDWQLPAATLECHRNHLRLDDQFVKILTLKEPPAKTWAHLLADMSAVDAQYILATEWRVRSDGDVRSLILSKRRHRHNSRTSILAEVTSSSSTSEVLVDSSAVAAVRQLGTPLEEMEVNGVRFGEFSLTLIVHDREIERVKRLLPEFFKLVSAKGGQLIEETYNALNAYLAVFPANWLYNLRRQWVSDVNYADLSFAFRIDGGETISPHLGAPCLATLETTARTPYSLNLHYQDVGHTVVIGSTGTGKSFLLNFLLTHAQKYSPKQFIFDLDGGFRSLARLLGGKHLAIGGGSEWPRINPFSLPPTPDNLRFLFSLLRLLVESNGYAMSAADERDLNEQIRNLYSVEPDQRRLFTLRNIVRRPVQEQMHRWVEGGPYGRLFDHAEDELTFADFQSFDFHGMDRQPQLLEALLFYVLYRANAAVDNERERSRLKLFVIDEAWRFFRHPTTRAYITEILKTGRKKNASILISTQSPDDLIQSAMLQVVVEGCPSKFFLANPGMDRQQYRSLFHLTEAEVDAICRLVPKRQFLLKRPDYTKLLRLDVDPTSYWLYTSSPNDVAKRQRYFDEHGFAKGLELLARSPS